MSLLDRMRESAREEEAFFTEIRSRQPSFVTVTRPSRSGGPQHVMFVDAATGTPIDPEHPCSCAAGNEGRYCWAVLQTLQERGTPEVAAAAKALAESRNVSHAFQHRKAT